MAVAGGPQGSQGTFGPYAAAEQGGARFSTVWQRCGPWNVLPGILAVGAMS